MSLLLLMEELVFLSGKMAYLVKMGSHHGWGTHMLRCVGISKNMSGDQSKGTSKVHYQKLYWKTSESYSALDFLASA